MNDLVAFGDVAGILDRLDGDGLRLARREQGCRDKKDGAECQNGGLESMLHNGVLLYLYGTWG